MSNEVGAPSLLTPELTLQIRKLVLQDVSFVQIQEILGIKDSTWDSWYHRNTQGFRELLNSWRYERIVKKAEANLEQLLQGEDEKIRADLTKFALERLNKLNFSSRTEHTGKDGEDIVVNLVSYKNEDNSTPQISA